VLCIDLKKGAVVGAVLLVAEVGGGMVEPAIGLGSVTGKAPLWALASGQPVVVCQFIRSRRRRASCRDHEREFDPPANIAPHLRLRLSHWLDVHVYPDQLPLAVGWNEAQIKQNAGRLSREEALHNKLAVIVYVGRGVVDWLE
jgi:hypothetical protein